MAIGAGKGSSVPTDSIAAGPSGKGHGHGAHGGSGETKGQARGGRLGDLVSDYLHRSPSSRPETSREKLNETLPSKTLPSTGLKRNTQEWKDGHPDEDVDGEQQLPSTATGGGQGQGKGEGPRGRGAGKHEGTIPLDRVEDQSEDKDSGWLDGYASKAFGLDGEARENGHRPNGNGAIHDSPQSSHSNLPSSSPTADFPKSSAFTSSLPHRSSPDASPNGDSSSGDAHRRRTGSNQGRYQAQADGVNGTEKDEGAEKDGGKYQEGGHERSDTHDSERNRKFTDELGRYPAMLKGVKEEEAPGNRNDIVLDPRVTHMHYHQEIKHENAQIIHGPILTVTNDGEQEYLPGQTPIPSRTASHQSKMSAPEDRSENPTSGNDHDAEHHKGYGPKDATRADRVERQQDAYERGMREASFSGKGKGKGGQSTEMSQQASSDGVWRSAMDPEEFISDSDTPAALGTPRTKRPGRKESRWSSFRDDPHSKHAATPSHPHARKEHPLSQTQSHRNSTYSGVEADTSDVDGPSRSSRHALNGQQTPNRQDSGSADGTTQVHRDRDGDAQDPDRHRQQDPEHVHEHANSAWSNLRSRVMPSRQATSAFPSAGGEGVHGGGAKQSAMAPSAVAALPVTTELMAGQLPVMIMKTWLDRDEDGNRAVPVVLGSLRFRVGDSVGLKAEGGQTGKEMFKLECEYGDGAVKWVIYRELRDFLSLHAHYKAANFGTSVPGVRSSRHVDIPEFPKMSIPYLKTISGGGRRDREKPMSKQEYAQASRDALQKYLVELIRAVIFRPESNRLCKFFELSALTLSLAPRGGFQGKAGFLKIPGSNASRRANQPGISPISWMNNRSPKWFIIRDSYFVATDGPESSDIYEVFLIDEDFHIERPKRVYRTGMHFLTGKGTIKRRKEGAPHMLQNGEIEVDPQNPAVRDMLINSGEGTGEKGLELDQSNDGKDASHHTFFIVNSQRKLKLVAKNARQMHQFIVSMERIAASCVWSGRNRFDSYAPLRVNCSAQWLVDGRDYFWNLSRAINMAKERIYIHDWWLSPEIYLRRPGNERYRLDHLLKRKAEEGVKVCIIIYNEVSDNFTPVDSTYTKSTLTGLHPNIMVQRSPSHFQTGTFYWSHHEKLCVIDETIAFMGGLDLCFGRWDTPQHVLTDEDYTEPNGPNGPVFHGKDYANERVAEYAALNKPFEDSIDRHKVPRMPWHDVGVQLVGQPARDLCRHFVQRWNLLLRIKNHRRKIPFLLPPPDFVERELEELKLRGTCEVQICRSVGPWSMNTLEKVEHSIQNAYVKSISLSEHFVYIENQFFITSTVVDGIPVENGIGDAIVNRIIRAHKEKTPWRACIVIPLLPGYTFPIDASEASSVRLILECQNRTICRGTNSIYSRLRAEGIDPNDYISFFSLRGWAKFKSGALTTEQVYIHGKTCIIDDRLALIGSANINERSQMGDRDSELLSVIRDTDMIDGTMAGKPFKVGRFAHTLRMRLMREHVGVDVDAIEEDELITREPIADADEIEVWDPDHEQHGGDDEESRRGITSVKRRTAKDRLARTFQSGAGAIAKGVVDNIQSDVVQAGAKMGNVFASATSGKNSMIGFEDGKNDESERRDNQNGKVTEGFAGSVVPTMEEKTIYERRPSQVHGNGQPLFDLIEGDETPKDGEELTEAKVHGDESVGFGEQVPADKEQTGRGIPFIREPPGARKNADEEYSSDKAGRVGDGKEELYGMPANAPMGDNDVPNANTERDESTEQERLAVKARKTLRKHLNAKTKVSAWRMPTPTPMIDPNRFHDPLDEKFWKDMWTAVAVHNTEIYRKVFRCIPDDLVTSWAQYKAFASHAEKFNMTPVDVTGPGTTEPTKVHHDGGGTHGAGGGGSGGGIIGQEGQSGHVSESQEADVVNGKPRDTLDVPGRAHSALSNISRTVSDAASDITTSEETKQKQAAEEEKVQEERKQSQPNEAFHDWEREEMEELLGELRGHLVIYPTRFMEAEDAANNFLFNSDKIMPLPIFN